MIKMNSRGSMIIPFVLSVGIAFLTAFMFMARDYMAQGQRMLVQSAVLNLEMFKNGVRAALMNPESYSATINLAANGDLLLCLNDPTYTCPAGARPLTIVTVRGCSTGACEVFANPNQGLRFDLGSTGGFTCTSFSAVAGTDSCPFQYAFTWTPDCPPVGVCRKPRIVVNGTLQFSPGMNTFPFKTTRYSFVTALN